MRSDSAKTTDRVVNPDRQGPPLGQDRPASPPPPNASALKSLAERLNAQINRYQQADEAADLWQKAQSFVTTIYVKGIDNSAVFAPAHTQLRDSMRPELDKLYEGDIVTWQARMDPPDDGSRRRTCEGYAAALQKFTEALDAVLSADTAEEAARREAISVVQTNGTVMHRVSKEMRGIVWTEMSRLVGRLWQMVNREIASAQQDNGG